MLSRNLRDLPLPNYYARLATLAFDIRLRHAMHALKASKSFVELLLVAVRFHSN